MANMKVLFASANPKSMSRLKLDEEVRLITEKIRSAEYRDYLEFTSIWAARADDLIQAFNVHKPHIVHFSGHGTKTGEIVLLSNDSRNTTTVGKKAIRALFETFKDNIQVVVLNACYSRSQAEVISEIIDYTIGMNTKISDESAILFSASFYRALGFGRTIQEAFEQGKLTLLLEGFDEEDTPELLIRKGVDPSKPYAEQISGNKVDSPHSPPADLDKYQTNLDRLNKLLDNEVRNMIYSILSPMEQSALPLPVNYIDRGTALGAMQRLNKLDAVEAFLLKHYSDRFV